jgi:hypothetical protein
MPNDLPDFGEQPFPQLNIKSLQARRIRIRVNGRTEAYTRLKEVRNRRLLASSWRTHIFGAGIIPRLFDRRDHSRLSNAHASARLPKHSGRSARALLKPQSRIGRAAPVTLGTSQTDCRLSVVRVFETTGWVN